MPDNLSTLLGDLARAAEQSPGLAPAAQVRRRGDARTRNGRVAAVVVSVVALGAAAAGSAVALRHAGPDHPVPANTVSQTPRPPAPSSAPSVAPSANAVPPSGGPETSPPQARLSATIGGLPADPTLAVGGDWLQFTVTITNGTGGTSRDIAPVVSLGHCDCSGPQAGEAPTGQIQVLDPATGGWQAIPFDREGTGADYRFVKQVAGADLAPGASRSFTYRIRIDAQQPYPIHSGRGTVDVTVVTHPGDSAQAVAQQAIAPIRYTG